MTSSTLLLWIRVVLVIAAISVTAVPVIYAGSPWRSRSIGRLFMLQAIAFAIAVDVRVVFLFWKPDMIIIFWINAITLTFVAIAAASLAILIWKMRYFGRSK